MKKIHVLTLFLLAAASGLSGQKPNGDLTITGLEITNPFSGDDGMMTVTTPVDIGPITYRMDEPTNAAHNTDGIFNPYGQSPVAKCKNITVDTDGSCQNSVVKATDFDGGSSDPEFGDELSFSVFPIGPYKLGLTNITLTVENPNGDASTCTATITVEDNLPPTALCKNVTVQLDATGWASIRVPDVNNGSNDVCGIGGLSLTPARFNCEDVGSNTVTLFVTDKNKNEATCTANVTVEDNLPPTALCKNVTVQLDESGDAVLTSADIDGGSYDNCSFVSLNINISSFDCYELGDHDVMLTATDNKGQSTSCTATVTVSGPDADCDGVADLCDLCPGGDDKVDNNHDGSPDCIDFPGIKKLIEEWTCGKGKKVTICHIPDGDFSKRNTLCIDLEGLADHLAHGDYIGECDNASCDDATSLISQQTNPQPGQQFNIYPTPASQGGAINLEAFPNPFGNEQTVRVQLVEPGWTNLQVYNLQGQLVRQLYQGELDAGVHQFQWSSTEKGEALSSGIYLLRLQSVTGVVVKKVSIQRY